MAINAQQTVIGVFDERGLAEKTVEDLQNAGFRSDQIYYSGSDETDKDYYDTAFWTRVSRLLTRAKTTHHDALS